MSRTPRILVLHSENIGDRNQAETLARLLGWPYQLEKLQPPRRPRVPKISGPQPDLIITVNKPSTILALRMKARFRRPVKVVRLGNYVSNIPVDLDIIFGQSGASPGDKVVLQQLPFSLIDASQFGQVRTAHPDLENLPQPRIAALIGGRNRYFQWSPEIAQRLGRDLNAAAKAVNGSLMLTTSFRTGREAADALLAEITVPHASYVWGVDTTPNPIAAYLAFCDRTVVTMDSTAMVSDGLNAGKPVSVYGLRPKKFALLKAMTEWLFPASRRTALIKTLVQSGEITWFGDTAVVPKRDHRSRYAPAVEAVRKLVEGMGRDRPEVG